MSNEQFSLTEICSTMSEDRLEALVLVEAHRKRVTELAINNIIDKFAACGSRKVKFLFPLLMLLSFTYV